MSIVDLSLDCENNRKKIQALEKHISKLESIIGKLIVSFYQQPISDHVITTLYNELKDIENHE